jgi:Holliday junction DNA helicase RuvB
MLSGLGAGGVLFIDELHRLPVPVAECLYSALDERSLPLTLVSRARARAVRLRLDPFLLIGATTEESLLPRPLHSRFGIRERLDFYSEEELAAIALRAGEPVKVTQGAARILVRGARGTPRWLLSHLRRASDLAQLEAGGAGEVELGERHALEALRLQGIDGLGLSELDRKLLRILLSSGRPLGLRSLSDLAGEDLRAIAQVYEPYQFRAGFIQRTHRGRVATERARRLLTAS